MPRCACSRLKPAASPAEKYHERLNQLFGERLPAMGHVKLAEQRKFHRIASDQVISFAEIDRPELLGVSKNISTGGISFEVMGVEINLGDILRVTFNVGDQAIVASGEVVWATDTDPITQEVGIEFHEIDARAIRLLEEAIGPSLEPIELY